MRTGLLLILLAGFILQSCEEEFPAPPSTIVKPPDVSQLNKVRGYTNWYINDFRCGVYVPADYDSTRKYPLIIFLHGHSDTITHSLPWYKEPFISKDPCIVLTPKCPVEETEGWGSTFYVAMSPMLDRAFYMVTLAEMAFNLDRSRYYIYGSSMGGYGTYAALSAYPDRFAAAYGPTPLIFKSSLRSSRVGRADVLRDSRSSSPPATRTASWWMAGAR